MTTMEEIYAANTMTYEEVWRSYKKTYRPKDKEDGIADLMRKAGVPERFVGAEEDTSHDLTGGKGLVIFGAQGSGKTTKAAGVLKGWVTRHRGKARFVTSADLLTEISATYSTSDTELSVLRKYGRCSLLVIDDLGKENPTDQALTKLWQVIDTRYGAMLPTIVTTQYDLAGMARELGRKGGTETAKAIVSRLYETCKPLSMGTVDHRRK